MTERKFLTILFLSLFLFLNACQKPAGNVPVKETDVVVMTPSPSPANSAADQEMKKAVEENLKKKNLKGITVEVSGGVVTLSGGPVTLDQLPEAMMAAKAANAKDIENKLDVK